MIKDLDVFLKRLFSYRVQYLLGAILAFAIWYSVGLLIFKILKIKFTFDEGFMIFAIPFCFSLFNTVTYFYSTHLAKKYGIEMFSDLDQDWLREHQAFDSKAFGEIFARLIHCRKIAGPYMLAIITPLAFINMHLATGVGVIYFIGYFFYRMTYVDDAVSYKVPRTMGGSGEVISKIIDPEFNERLDRLNKNLEQKN